MLNRRRAGRSPGSAKRCLDFRRVVGVIVPYVKGTEGEACAASVLSAGATDELL